DSLALDVMEAVRPDVDAWLLNFLRGRTFARSHFAELPNGVVRITANLARELCQTAPLRRKLIAPVAEQVAQQVVRVTRPDAKVPTRLTNAKRTNATRARNLTSEQVGTPAAPTPLVAPESPSPPRKEATPDRRAGIARNCPECGKHLPSTSRATFCSPECADAHTREGFLVATAVASQSPEAKQKRSESNSARKAETLGWERAHPEVDLARERERFHREILPRLPALTMRETADVLGCSLS